MIYYILQYPTGDYMYIHSDMTRYPCKLHDAEIFTDKKDAERYAAANGLIVRTINIELVD